jgi:hypothetical protein
MYKKIWFLLLLLLWVATGAFGADTVLTWPSDGSPVVLRFTVGKLRQVSSISSQSDLLGEALAESLGTKAIPTASFYLYLLDKNGKRVGEGYLEVTNLAPGQQAKIPVSVHTLGAFAKMELQPQHLPTDEPMKIKMSITSVPSGASLKLDSQEAGVTPQLLSVAPGKHVVEFSKEGYATESTPLEVVENAPPGTLNLELNPLKLDTVVLRDGTVLTGTLISVTGTAVAISAKGKTTRLERSRVARVVFGESKPSGGKFAKTSSGSSHRKK